MWLPSEGLRQITESGCKVTSSLQAALSTTARACAHANAQTPTRTHTRNAAPVDVPLERCAALPLLVFTAHVHGNALLCIGRGAPAGFQLLPAAAAANNPHPQGSHRHHDVVTLACMQRGGVAGAMHSMGRGFLHRLEAHARAAPAHCTRLGSWQPQGCEGGARQVRGRRGAGGGLTAPWRPRTTPP